jgi:NAD(P)-dependent dehydrogenase (short-subunit alcohol dehydrogenase family)
MKVLVTAAGRAIGAEICHTLAREGHEVIATARDTSLLEALPVAQTLPLDVTDEASIDAVVKQVGAIDALVNNAALGGGGPLETFPLDHLRVMFETNTFGALRLTQRFIPTWRDQGAGVIVNISSVQGRVSSPLSGPYAATKFALEALSESLHYELGHFGIRTVLIEPGFTAPGMKPVEGLPRPAIYDDLYQQWEGTDTQLAGAGGRPGPELVARAVAQAIVDPATPFRVPVGEDANLILSVRSQLNDVDFEATMRATLGLIW